jgi:PKD repeat protein
MTYQVPREIQSARAQTLGGVTYTAGQVLTPAQILALPHLSALLSSGRLTAVPDVHERKAVRGNRTPTNIPPVPLAVLTAIPDFSVDVVLTATNKLHATATMTGGDGPFSVDWGDSSTSSVKGRVSTHTYATAGPFTITVTADNGDTATDSVTTIAPPVADFVFTPTGLSVAFNDTTTGQTSRNWDWGDGTADGTTADPTHVYGAAGTYTVTYTATGLGGDTVVVKTVTVA